MGVSIRFSFQIGIGVTYDNFFVNFWMLRHKSTTVLLLFKWIYRPSSIQAMAVIILKVRRGYDIIEWWIPYEKLIQAKRVFCVYTATLVNFPRKLDIQLCIIQQYNAQKLINWILAGFCTNYQYASMFSYNIFMCSLNHMELEVSCRLISWSTETSRVTGLLIPVTSLK